MNTYLSILMCINLLSILIAVVFAFNKDNDGVVIFSTFNFVLAIIIESIEFIWMNNGLLRIIYYIQVAIALNNIRLFSKI